MYIEGLEKVINFRQKNPIGLTLGKLHTGLRVSFYTIYLHKCESKLKCITAVDLKITLDPQR